MINPNNYCQKNRRQATRLQPRTMPAVAIDALAKAFHQSLTRSVTARIISTVNIVDRFQVIRHAVQFGSCNTRGPLIA